IWAIWEKLLPYYHIIWPWQGLVAVMLVWGIVCVLIFIFTTNVLNKHPEMGLTSMVGLVGEVAAALDPEGQVVIKGERWQAVSEEGKIEAGEEIVVTGERGLQLTVRLVRR
ncbi:MAG TPA: NfeD family protein, partial [Dehalococcoidales bacterium]|nr:NfeD family protein [Dehalococcoidales bacterium]